MHSSASPVNHHLSSEKAVWGVQFSTNLLPSSNFNTNLLCKGGNRLCGMIPPRDWFYHIFNIVLHKQSLWCIQHTQVFKALVLNIIIHLPWNIYCLIQRLRYISEFFKCIFSLNGSCLKILFLLKCPTIAITLFRTTRCDVRDTAQGTSKTALCRKCITGVLLKGLVRVIAVKCTTSFLWGLLQTVDVAGLVSFTGRKPWTWHSLLKVYWFIHALSW